MRKLKTDVAVIGAGTAGQNARAQVERAGKDWLLIEAGSYGTMCARTGCMPSKLLLAAAQTAHRARRAGLFGVQIAPEAIRVDGQAVLERVRRERDRFSELNAQSVEKLPAEKRIRGIARFVGPTSLEVDDHTHVEAKAIVIATGSKPIVPREIAPLGDAVLTTDTLFELDTLPDSIAVFGTGAIGLELGQALHHLGVRVAFYNPLDQVGGFTDPVVRAGFHELLTAELDLTLGGQVTHVRQEDGCVVIRHRDPKGSHRERKFARVLAAVGRRPALEALKLEAAEIELDQAGAPTFARETMQCGSSPIFVAGDVDGDRTILHEAVDDGVIAGANAARFPEVKTRTQKVPLRIAFTTPQMAQIGPPFDEASDLAIGESSYDDQGRARVMGQNRGLVRVYADRASQRLIGAELYGPGVEHTAHLLAWAVQQQQTVSTLLSMPFYHPTLEEGLRTAFRVLAKNLSLEVGVLTADSGDSAGA
ncbi:MAG: dihydrolipoyl dehydrogenase [Polyangiales bacterium]